MRNVTLLMAAVRMRKERLISFVQLTWKILLQATLVVLNCSIHLHHIMHKLTSCQRDHQNATATTMPDQM
jgi:hypothetical protein